MTQNLHVMARLEEPPATAAEVADEVILEEALEDDIMEDICEKEPEDMVALLADWAEDEEPPAAAPPDAPSTARTPP